MFHYDELLITILYFEYALYPLESFFRKSQIITKSNCALCGFPNRSKKELMQNPQYCCFSLIFSAVLESTDK